jgi:hypothetical protein
MIRNSLFLVFLLFRARRREKGKEKEEMKKMLRRVNSNRRGHQTNGLCDYE